MMNSPFLPALSIFSSVLLGSCTGSGSPTEKEGENETAATAAAVRTPGTRADSLGGIPGHPFGEPLSAFPGLELTTSQRPGSQSYHYPGGKGEPGWFGKRKKESPTEFYSFYVFKDGHFAAFQAMALGAGRPALREQVQYLLGAGTPTTTTTNWEGERVFAFSEAQLPGSGPSETLDVQSQDFRKAQATAQADRLKQENAGQ